MTHPLILFIADRVNVIGLENHFRLIDIAYDCGIRAISVDQHSRGGNWTPAHIADVKRVLSKCKTLGIEVYMTAQNGSKCDYGSPNGLLVKGDYAHRPYIKKSVIDRNRVAYRFLIHSDKVYQVRCSVNKPCTAFLRCADDETWQLIKFDNVGKSSLTENMLEFRSAKNEGYHDLIFVSGSDGDSLGVMMERPVSVKDLASIQPGTFQVLGNWYYRGRDGHSGNSFCRTPNFNDRPARLAAYRNTFGMIAKTYSEYIGNPIVGTRLEWDEFNYVGGLCDGKDMLDDMKLCGIISQSLIGPAIVDARPSDLKHPARNNAKDAWYGLPDWINPAKLIGEFDGLIGCSWQEETTPELCAENKRLSHPDALGGIYLTRSDPQHWYNAGFRSAGIYFFPRDVKRPDGAEPTWLDIPQDKLRNVVSVFGGGA